jgi:hypothetical protein
VTGHGPKTPKRCEARHRSGSSVDQRGPLIANLRNCGATHVPGKIVQSRTYRKEVRRRLAVKWREVGGLGAIRSAKRLSWGIFRPDWLISQCDLD